MAQNNQANQRFMELKKLIGDQESRIQFLQTSGFQFGELPFRLSKCRFRCNSNSLTCSDAWFVFTLSLLAATINLLALCSIGMKYLRAMDVHNETWDEYNEAFAMLSHINRRGAEPSLEGSNQIRHDMQWKASPLQQRGYAYLTLYMILFLAFTGLMLSGPWMMICKQEHKKHPHMDCLKLCDGSKCITFCRDI